CGSKRDRQVHIPRRADIYNINVLAADYLFPGSGVFQPAKVVSGFNQFAFVAAANHFQDWFAGHVKKAGHLSPGVAVSSAHEPITDQRDVKFSHDLPGKRLLTVSSTRSVG